MSLRLLLIFPLLSILSACSNEPAVRKVVVAYIGRYTNAKDTLPVEQQKPSPFDLLHERVLHDYFDRLSDSLGNVRLVLKTFDCQREARVSDSLYRAIAADSSIALVVDNTWGAQLIPSAPKILAGRIPVISMNADRDSAEFGATAIFIGNDDDVPGQMADYLSRGLNIKRVNLISETDYALHPRYLKDLETGGITVGRLFGFQGKDKDKEGLQRMIDSVIAWYKSTPSERTIPLLLNAHNIAGDNIIDALDSALDGVTLVGGAYVASVKASKKFGRHPANRIIIMGRPTDAVSRDVALDVVHFQSQAPTIFDSPSTPFFLQRCRAVTAFIGKILSDSATAQNPTRKAIASGIERLRGHSVIGDDDLYDLDTAGNLQEEVYFTTYQGGQSLSLPIQLNRAHQPVPNLFLGIDMVSIHDLDVNTNTFKADFFYWIKVDSAISSAEKFLLFTNMVENQSSRQLLMEKIDGRILYRLYKTSGLFQQQYELINYPLDEQELAIHLEILNPSDKLRISFDQKSVEEDPAILDRFKVQAWKKLRYFVTVDNRVTESMRGDPERREGEPTVFKTISFRLQVKRKLLGPLLEIVLPLSLIGFISIALLYVKDISFENLGEVSVGTFLGIITFSIALSNITPNSDYLTRADLLFWTTFLIVLISFMTIIVVNSRYRLHELEGVSIHVVRNVLSLIYPLAMAAILVW